MSSPRLLILSFSRISADARVLKQVHLFKEQYRVITCGYGPKPDGVEDHIEIPENLVAWKYPRAAVIARAYARAYWGNPVIAHLRPLLRRGHYDIILANDIDTAGLALSLKPARGVHLDLHEYCPRMKEELFRWKLFMGPFMAWMVRKFGKQVNSITTVATHIAEEYRRQFGVQAGVVTNAAPFVDRTPTPVHTPIRLVHSGAAKKGRFLEVTLDAMDALKSDATLDLFLTQNHGEYFESLRARIQGMRNVVLHDPVPYDQLNSTLSKYDVGIFLLPPVNFNYEWTLPNKFFDFVQARLGIIIGPSPEMAAVLTRANLGVVTEDFSSDALARAIDSLTPETVATYKASAHNAAAALSAEEQLKHWVRAIEELQTIGSAP